LICEAGGPIVQGLGFAAVRDLVSFLKHDTSKLNPLLSGKKSAITRAHAFGVSQSGRFLRHLLYQGFNIDEKGRRVFDGLMPHVAGGGLGFFNHRFAQPTRHNGQHEEHLYPTDIFPFTYGTSRDEYRAGGKTVTRDQPDGILKRIADEGARLLPRVMHTQSSAEYWHRSGSLVHTDTLGTRDAEVPANVRIYAFGGTQHGPLRPRDPGAGEGGAPPPGQGVHLGGRGRAVVLRHGVGRGGESGGGVRAVSALVQRRAASRRVHPAGTSPAARYTHSETALAHLTGSQATAVTRC
jgi:hypothetical protein